LDIGNIVKNSLGYPLSNMKNFLILGVIILLADLYSFSSSLGINNSFIVILMVITFLLMILREGYKLRILGSSISGSDILPDFGNWKRMFLDGVNLFIVTIIFMIPLIIIFIVGGMIIGMFSYSSGVTNIGSGRMMIMTILAISGLYVIVVYPILLMAFANMANNKNSISHGLKFGAILSKISHIGLGSFVGWYIVTGIIFVILLIIGTAIPTVFELVNVEFIGIIISAIIIEPFITIFLMRSTALIYKSTIEVQAETGSSEDREQTI
jgi:hypothetical protein